MSDQRCSLQQRLPSRRNSNHDIILVGKPAHEQFISSQECDKQGASALSPSLLNAAVVVFLDHRPIGCSDKTLQGRSRAVGRQFQNRGRLFKLLQPILLDLSLRLRILLPVLLASIFQERLWGW